MRSGKDQRLEDGFDFYATGAGPYALIIIQEIFGVTDFLRRNADWFAGRGFHTVAPDLFWRLERNLALGPDQAEKARRLMGEYDEAGGVEDINALAHHLRKNGAEKVFLLGYCLGGAMAAIASARCDIDAAVGYYGVRIQERLKGATPKAPLLLHIAEEDTHVSKDEQARLKAAFRPLDHVYILSHARQDHAFCREGGPAYDAQAAGLAHAATLNFFAQKGATQR